MTKFASFSFTLPLLHFFFLERPPAIAAFILASFDFWTTLFAPMAGSVAEGTQAKTSERCGARKQR